MIEPVVRIDRYALVERNGRKVGLREGDLLTEREAASIGLDGLPYTGKVAVMRHHRTVVDGRIVTYRPGAVIEEEEALAAGLLKQETGRLPGRPPRPRNAHVPDGWLQPA